MSKSSNYWRKREHEWKKADLKDEAEYIQEIQDIYSTMLTQINKEIESFFVRYSNKEGMSMAEAKRKASDIDIKEYEKKAKKYVKEKDFSKEANEQMRLYNLAMKVNRLELLKANIGLELTAGSDELVSFTKEKLEGAALEQIQRNAGILGDTIIDNAKTAKTIANSSFKNATFSERIWSQQDLLKNDLYGILSTALIQGRNPREFIPKVRKSFDVTRYQAERLLRTELTRVRIQAQAESYEANGIDEYEYVACGLKDVCPICKELDKQIFKLKDMEIGENAPPRHPNCHCALAPYSDRNEYEKWLNGLANGDHDIRFDEWKERASFKESGLRTKDKGDYGVKWNVIKGKNYTRRFDALSDNPKANQLAATKARNMLKHRDGRNTEELYAISLTSAKDVSNILDQHNPFGVTRTEKFNRDMERAEEANNIVLLMHNHPNGYTPSIDDLNELLNHKNAVGLTVGHNGTLFFYSKPKTELTESDLNVVLMKCKGYNSLEERYIQAMEMLSKDEKFLFEFKVF